MIDIKRILIVSSAYTGAGHQSIADALTEQFLRMPDVRIQVIDGFELMGRAGIHAGRIYGFLTRHAPLVYNMAWRMSMKHPPEFTLTEKLCLRRFTECVRRFNPDLILTVHSLFNTVLTRMLQHSGIDIPVVVFQADLIDIHSTWCNPDAYMTICPTDEAFDASVRQGMEQARLRVMGFPIRSRFCEAAGQTDPVGSDPSVPLRCLMMGGGEGVGSFKAYAETILGNTNAELTIICGRNKKLRRQLSKRFKEPYGDRVKLLGFVPDVEREMIHSDLLITRSSPNTMIEAVVMNLPMIMIGPQPEQEKDNPKLFQKYNLGVYSKSPNEAPIIIQSLLADDAARWKGIRQAQHAIRGLDTARSIAEYVAALTVFIKQSNSAPLSCSQFKDRGWSQNREPGT